ncbi:2-methoxy-6-polyprenyl-1,4-benzoquinol methylase, mitochondrial isoform X2 [Petaurus breviceps papuanus]|uniref:2-methoxy-6-polyprenyl-1,4-benzoquinol methylase, mitochondrial isoform X2 n=1 Tax=Petaurus breviceps papuanus TaxID=3040969 RepID=UPI0036DF2C04
MRRVIKRVAFLRCCGIHKALSPLPPRGKGSTSLIPADGRRELHPDVLTPGRTTRGRDHTLRASSLSPAPRLPVSPDDDFRGGGSGAFRDWLGPPLTLRACTFRWLLPGFALRVVMAVRRSRALWPLSGRGWSRALLSLRPPWGWTRPTSNEKPRQETHFGFETVSEEEKGDKVYQVFENVAKKYDLMNDSMSLGIHRIWKDLLLQKMHPFSGTKLLDVAGGTGDIAFRFLNYIKAQNQRQQQRELKFHQNLSWEEIAKWYQKSPSPLGESHVVVCDINKEMLKVGKQKAQTLGHREGLAWVVGDAEELPFDDAKFDVYTIAFGIRNVTHIDQALQEAHRVLRPGGRFLCLEFSQVNNPIISRFYDLYSFQVIPVMGEVIAGDWKSYQYLVESIRRFPAQEEFKEMIEGAGFQKVTYENLTSGIVAIHSGFKL